MRSTEMTVLVIDESQTQRNEYCRTLEDHGFHVLTAPNGAYALLRAQLLPDLILLEVRLPDINGFEVCRRLKANRATSQIPIVMVSASQQIGSSANHALQVGACAFLFCPFSTVQLLAVVSGSVRKAQAHDAECNWRLADAG